MNRTKPREVRSTPKPATRCRGKNCPKMVEQDGSMAARMGFCQPCYDRLMDAPKN
jgi:hypothetical protein